MSNEQKNLEFVKEILLDAAANLEGVEPGLAKEVKTLLEWLDTPERLVVFLSAYLLLYIRIPAVRLAAYATLGIEPGRLAVPSALSLAKEGNA